MPITSLLVGLCEPFEFGISVNNASQCVILKALVNPSMRNPDEALCAWVATRKAWQHSTLHLHGWENIFIHACIILFMVYTYSLYLSAWVKAACTTPEYTQHSNSFLHL